MKKRILSMLLLVVMLVTALPLSVLPTLAAEKEDTYDEADYNALYVQDGLTTALDYFTTNKYWGLPKKSSAKDESYLWKWSYFDANGNRNVSLPDNAGTIANGCLAMTAASTNLGGTNAPNNNAYNGTTIEYVFYDNAVPSSGEMLTIDNMRVHIESAKGVVTVGRIGLQAYEWGTLYYDDIAEDGTATPTYVQNLATFDYKAGVPRRFTMTMTRPTMTEKRYYQQIDYTEGGAYGDVALPDDVARISNSNLFYVMKLVDGKLVYVTSRLSPGFYPVFATTTVDGKTVRYVENLINRASGVDINGVTHNRFGIGYGVRGGDYYTTATGSIAMYLDGEELFDLDNVHWPNNQLDGGTYLKYSTNTSTRYAYAYRGYNRELKPEELKQNHFADIAKWFKLDLTSIQLLTPAEMAVDGGVYDAVADFGFTTGEGDREAAAAAVLAAARTALQKKYEGISTDYVEVALQYGLDIELLSVLPKSIFTNTYNFLENEIAASTDVEADYEAAIATDITVVLGGATNNTEALYNGLYVDTDLAFAADFFGTNSYWNKTYSVPIGPSENKNFLVDLNGNEIKDEGEVEYDLTNADNRKIEITVNGKTQTVYAYALSLWQTAYKEYMNKNFRWSTGNMAFKVGSVDEKTAVVPFDMSTGGYVLLNKKHNSGSGIQFDSIPNGTSNLATTGEIVLACNTGNNGKMPFFFHGVRMMVSATGGEVKFSGMNGESYMGGWYFTEIALYDANGKKGSPTFYQDIGVIDQTSARGVMQVHAQAYADANGYIYVKVNNYTADIYAKKADGTKGDQVARFTVSNKINPNASLALSTDAKFVYAYDEPFTMTQSLALDKNGDDTYTLRTEDGLAASITVEYSYGNKLYGGHIIGYNLQPDTRIYAIREYTRVLSDNEVAQNHFADIAKFYKLNLAGLDLLSDDAKLSVYKAVTDIAVGGDDTARAAAQLAITCAVHKAAVASYQSIKDGISDPNKIAFIDFAAEYYIDKDVLSKILNSDRYPTSLYATSLVGTRAEMQGLVEKAYHDAYYFHFYQENGNTAWNAWLNAVAAADAVENIEDLMLLPRTVRMGITDVAATDGAAITEYIIGSLAGYNALTAEDYNQLYLRDGLILAFDIMSTNSYWNEGREAIKNLPTLPNELTAYEFDINDDGVIDPEKEVFDFTKFENRFDTGKYVIQKKRTLKPGASGNNAEYLLVEGKTFTNKATFGNGLALQNTIMRFDTAEEAQKYINDGIAVDEETGKSKLEREDTSYTYTYLVMDPYLVTYAGFESASVTGRSGYSIDPKVSYKSVAAAEAEHKDTSARDYTVVPNAYNYAYYAAVADYYKKVNAWLREYTWSISDPEISKIMEIATANPLGNSNGFSQIRDFDMVRACFADPVTAQGYLTQLYAHPTDNGLTMSQPDGDVYKKSDNVTAQIVATFGSDGTFGKGVSNSFLIFYDARLNVKQGDGVFNINGFTDNSRFKISGTPGTDKAMSLTDVVSMTVSLQGGITRNEGDALDTLSVRTPIETVYEANGLYNGGNSGNLNLTNQLGYANSMGGTDIYAVRYYNRALTQEELQQNHFVDIAKWYQLDITPYKGATVEQRAKLHERFTKYTVNDNAHTREEIMKEYYDFFYNYEGVEEKLGKEMTEIATRLGLDVTELVAAKEEHRAYAESVVLADFSADQPMERKVVQAVLDQALVYSAGFAFEGIQVRLQSANEDQDMPGVRAIFSVNREVIEAYASLGRDVAFGVDICDTDGTTLSTLYFTVNPSADGYKYAGDSLVNGESIAPANCQVAEKSVIFAYTVIFNTEGVQNADYYNYEFTYRFFMEADGRRNHANMLGRSPLFKSPTFKETISAAEAYTYFFANGYENDRVVKSVVKELNSGNDVILVKTPEEAQAALDNATADTVIQLAPNVNYGTLVFRQTASSTVVDITDAGGDAPGNEKYRRIENLTILGAEGAIVDGFDFLVSWIDGSGASYIDIKNLTVKGVTFSGEATPFSLTKSGLAIDGLTIVDCKMNDENGNNRLVFQQISGYKVLNDKSTGEYVMTTGIKDLTITGCEVVGAYMVIESRAMENLTITDNTFYGIKARDMLITSDTMYYPDATYSGTITITGNTSECGEERFVRGSLNNSDVIVVIKDNTIVNYCGKDTDYIKVTDVDTANVTIENNIFVQ